MYSHSFRNKREIGCLLDSLWRWSLFCKILWDAWFVNW